VCLSLKLGNLLGRHRFSISVRTFEGQHLSSSYLREIILNIVFPFLVQVDMTDHPSTLTHPGSSTFLFLAAPLPSRRYSALNSSDQVYALNLVSACPTISPLGLCIGDHQPPVSKTHAVPALNWYAPLTRQARDLYNRSLTAVSDRPSQFLPGSSERHQWGPVKLCFSNAPVAQWIEHQTTDLGVTGSSPVGRTTESIGCCSPPRLAS
jgi:hypothetical protein